MPSSAATGVDAVAWIRAIHALPNCARRTRRFLSCAFCEQEGHLAALSHPSKAARCASMGNNQAAPPFRFEFPLGDLTPSAEHSQSLTLGPAATHAPTNLGELGQAHLPG